MTMIDIIRQKQFFPLKDFADVERLFEFNIDPANGEPNLTLLSIVAGLVEHSLVTVTDKEDLANNSRPVEDRKEVAQKKFGLVKTSNPSSSSNDHHHSSTSNDVNKDNEPHGSGQSSEYFKGTRHFSSNKSDCSSTEWTANDDLPIPEIEFNIVETLYKKFVDQFRGSSDFQDVETYKTNLRIKKISDSVWEHLSNSYYKDKAHLQSVFSYLTTSKLDCFGLAFAVIAGCQILNLEGIYLALSEDHAWVMFELPPNEYKALKEREVNEYIDNQLPVPTCAMHGTCEVTWHGKANSDKRGQPVVYKNCWLYTNGYAVKCDFKSCVVALVNSINPSINSNTDSEILALLQQRLLWLLYRRKNYFPMSLGNLGELENISPTPNAPLSSLELFNLGIEISRTVYNDSHVYPYSYLASFYFKHGRFKEALETWADSSAVMIKYNYSRDDEEIYKEFFEVANELIPSMLKVLTAGSLEPGQVSQKPILQDPECLALIFKFYDNICCWEEGSSTPVLHIGWAKNFVATVLKFSSIIRSKIKLYTEEEWAQNRASIKDRESSRTDRCISTLADHSEKKTTLSQSKEKSLVKDETTSVKDGKKGSSRKRALSMDEKVDTTDNSAQKLIRTDERGSIAFSPSSSDNNHGKCTTTKYTPRENRLEVDSENNVALILKSRKITGVRDLLQAERLNKTAIELQLTAQSQCAVRGRSNSNSYTDFLSTALPTRSKRLHR